ncbi:putative polyketide synthase 16, partial [Zopfia rhizophila CBS 207.26]
LRNTYGKAGLDTSLTRYREAHGTETVIGDPLEASAISNVFGGKGKLEDTKFVGAVKSNIRHLEHASGIAGIINTVLVLERAIIPPNANFQELNARVQSVVCDNIMVSAFVNL